MSLIIRAAQFAALAHQGVKRKYTLRPYIEHPMRVAGAVSLLPDVAEHHVTAAWLHDVIEDCSDQPNCNYESLAKEFGSPTAQLVRQLTNTSKLEHPEWNRARRKSADRERIRLTSNWAKRIKVIDRIDNLNELSTDIKHLPFRNLYFKESGQLLRAIYETRDYDTVIENLIQSALDAFPDELSLPGHIV